MVPRPIQLVRILVTPGPSIKKRKGGRVFKICTLSLPFLGKPLEALIANKLHNVGNSARVTPFVVVPAHHFNKVS